MIAILISLATLTTFDDPALGLADLDAYRIALAASPDPKAPKIQFRDLWNRPEAFAGRVVTVEGRVARIFRQPSLGEFPPLVEAWVVSPAGDPFCLIFPASNDPGSLEIGGQVEFSGTFLRRIKYQGGDASRLAPLIVGPASPTSPKATPRADGLSWSTLDWIMGLGASAVIATVLATRHLAKAPTPPERLEPRPIFIDGDPDAEEGNPDETAD